MGNEGVFFHTSHFADWTIFLFGPKIGSLFSKLFTFVSFAIRIPDPRT